MSSFIIDGYEVKEFADSKWLKIFDHNSSNEVFFANKEEALFSNTSEKFSILSYICSPQKHIRYYKNYL